MSTSQLHVSAPSLATLMLLLTGAANAGTPATCDSLTNFKFADTTINSAT
jgi:hypothetical protein